MQSSIHDLHILRIVYLRILRFLRIVCVGGYAAAAKHFKADDLNVKCDGKSFMITGNNSILYICRDLHY